MPVARFQMPDGRIARFEVPAGTTPEQAQSMMAAHFSGAASTPAAPQETREQIAAKIEADPITQGAKNFAKDMPLSEQVVAGYGGAVPGLIRGARQLHGALNPQAAAYNELTGLQAEVDERKRLDAPLMATPGGFGGNLAGNVVATLPAAAAGTGLKVAAGVGGAIGAAQPVATGESRTLNTGLGALAGPLGVMAGRGVNALYQGGKALIEPFSEAGRSRIAGRMLERFAENPNALSRATSAPTVTGARPTLAEQTGDPGIARLQDSLRSVDPLIENQIGGRLRDNNAARVNALRGLTGEDGARDFAVANRSGTAQQLYGDAFNVVPDAAMTAEQSRTMATLMRSPAIQSAMRDARAIGANRGTNVGPANGSGSIEGLHNMKMALDDAIQAATTAGNANKAASIKAAQTKLVGLIEELSPDYRTARKVYADMSRPINSFDVAADVARRGLSNGSDLAGNQTINRNALLGAMRDEPALIRRATGRNAGNALSDVMEPQDLALLRAIAAESDRAGAVATAGNGPGSATAQRMASQNVLRQIIGPTGLPQSWAENALANTVVGKPLNLIYGGVAEPRIQQMLARAVLDPDAARSVLAMAQAQRIQLPPGALKLLMTQAGRSAAPVAVVPGQR